MRKQQIEITLTVPRSGRQTPTQPRRTVRARWWFSQMRRVVDDAREWKPASTISPEQIHLPLAQSHR
jgi:hypothetical protein